MYVIDTGIYAEHEYFGGRAHFAYDATETVAEVCIILRVCFLNIILLEVIHLGLKRTA